MSGINTYYTHGSPGGQAHLIEAVSSKCNVPCGRVLLAQLEPGQGGAPPQHPLGRIADVTTEQPHRIARLQSSECNKRTGARDRMSVVLSMKLNLTEYNQSL